MKIPDIVKFNDGMAFVVDEMPTLTYEKMAASQKGKEAAQNA